MRRVRFPPSPTGSLHVGNALTAAANRAFGDWFHLRIDDAISSIADLRDAGIPAEAVRAYLDELGMPKHDTVRELKAAGGDLRALRLALTGREWGPELWTVIHALPRDEALRRIDAAL
jgi:glutamyl/glutaminyl-tRNA synthetase